MRSNDEYSNFIFLWPLLAAGGYGLSTMSGGEEAEEQPVQEETSQNPPMETGSSKTFKALKVVGIVALSAGMLVGTYFIIKSLKK